jgi:HTH-type transcriptional regulator/antitoxin HigA
MTAIAPELKRQWKAIAPYLTISNMEEHSLSQSDLPEIGSQGVVSEILNGKRKLNIRQIQALAKRFRVSPATFLTEDKIKP